MNSSPDPARFQRTPLGLLLVGLERSRLLLWAFGLLLLLAIALFDNVTGVEIGVAIFYLLPICIVQWLGARRDGVIMATLSAVTMYAVNSWIRLPLGVPLELRAGGGFVPLWNAMVGLASFMLAVSAMDRIKQSLEREKLYGYADHLTGLPNRRAFYESAARESNRCHRARRPLTLAYVDCDNFKACNDQLGHEAGDRLLQAAAGTMRSQLRLSDVVARLGGDEFAILLPDADHEVAARILTRLHSALTDAMLQRQPCPVTFSIGAMTFPVAIEAVDEMVRQADRLMYRAKASGKGTVRHELFVPECDNGAAS